MNYYKYLLFAILSYSFINYQYFLRPETIIEIVFGNVLIFFVLEYIILHKYALNIPFIKNKKNKKKKKKHIDNDSDDSDDLDESNDSNSSSEEKSKESLIDNNSLELLINEQDEEEIIHQANRPPYLNY
jgi:predicted membrane protein